MSSTDVARAKTRVNLQDPPLARFLWGDTRLSILWLVIRVFVGYQWLTSGLGKISNQAWIGPNAGAALGGFVRNALTLTGGDHPSVQGWYAWFLENIILPIAPVMSYVVVIGELLVGIALILGLFTGIAAFFGGFMNVNYLLAGTVSTNPFLFVFATWLVLAWKTAGWLGLDRWVLPLLSKVLRPEKVYRAEG